MTASDIEVGQRLADSRSSVSRRTRLAVGGLLFVVLVVPFAGGAFYAVYRLVELAFG